MSASVPVYGIAVCFKRSLSLLERQKMAEEWERAGKNTSVCWMQGDGALVTLNWRSLPPYPALRMGQVAGIDTDIQEWHSLVFKGGRVEVTEPSDERYAPPWIAGIALKTQEGPVETTDHFALTRVWGEGDQ